MPTGALGVVIPESEPLAARLMHFKNAMHAVVAQLNLADQSVGINRSWRISTEPNGSDFTVYVSENGAQEVRAAYGGYSTSSRSYAVTTTGFSNLTFRRTSDSAGSRFYDGFYGALIASGISPHLDALTNANIARMPVNRLRAMLKWGAIFNDFTRAIRLLSPMPSRAAAIWGTSFRTGMRADAAFLFIIRSKVMDKIGDVNFNGRSFTVNGNEVTREELGRLAHAQNLSGDYVALAGLANAMSVAGVKATTIANRFLATQMASGPMLFSREASTGLSLAELEARIEPAMFAYEAAAKRASEIGLRMLEINADASTSQEDRSAARAAYDEAREERDRTYNAWQQAIQDWAAPHPEDEAKARFKPLAQIPQVQGATGPIPAIVEVAENYARSINKPFNRQREYVAVDEALARRIASAYENMQHAPNDPKVQEAYRQLIEQTRAQYDALVEAGFNFTFMGATDPYNGNPWNAMRDLRQNKHMAVFPTVQGYGSNTEADTSEHPLLEDSGIRWVDADGNLKPVLFNDLFRAVHDTFGHGLEGAGFRARGEENAWQAHARLFTGAAIGALTSETRGQNSWLNYGPYGDTNRAASVHDTIFADQKAGLMPSWTWEEGFDSSNSQTSVLKKTFAPAKAQPESKHEASQIERLNREQAVVQAMDEGLVGELYESDPEFSPPRETYTEVFAGLAAGRQAAPATIPRGVMNALRTRNGKALREYLQAGANELNDALHNALGVTERWIGSVPTAAPEAQDQARHALYLAPGRRDAMLAEANREHGGFQLQELLRSLSAKHKLSLETVIDWAGRWASARYAEQRNAWLLDKFARELSEASAVLARVEQDHAAALQSGTRGQRLIRATLALRAARNEVRRAARTLRKSSEAVFNPDPTVAKPEGPVAGYSNAQAAHLMMLVERQIDRADLEAVSERLYDLNAWALTLDIESGRVTAQAAGRYINTDAHEALFNTLRSAAVAYSSSAVAASGQVLTTLQDLRAQVKAAVRSQYVPLTGNPEEAMTSDTFSGSNARQPNTTNERQLRGRTSVPDDAITATLGRLTRSASYAGWAPFQDAIASLYNSMTPEQREAAGIRREIVPSNANPVGRGLVRRRANTVEVYEFRDKKILAALQEYNRGADAVYARLLGAPSRWYAYMATQANLSFGLVNLMRDAWERSELVRSKHLKDASGSTVNSDHVARRLLSYVFDPRKNFELFGATMRYAFKRPAKANSYADRLLQELSTHGGISVRGDTFSSSRTALVKDAAKSKVVTGIRDFIDSYNRLFDMLPLLASHMALREAGLTAEAAAAEALDLFNFRKRGKLTKYIAPMFAFAQTSFTGGANMIGALYNPHSKAPKFGNTHFLRKGVVRLLGTTVVFVALQALARALAGDDEAGNKLAGVNRFTQDSNLLLPLPGNDTYLRVPLAFGLTRLAHGMARNILAVGNEEATVSEALGSFIANNLNPTISPLEGTSIDMQKRPFQALMMVAAPSWAKPLAAVAQNRDSNDVPIVFDTYAKSDEYRSEKFGRNSAPLYKEVAKEIRVLTGVDLAPEEVEHLIRSYPTGSIGQLRQIFVDNAHLAARGRPVSNPILSRFVGVYGDGGKLSQFYKGLEASDEVTRRLSSGAKLTREDSQLLAWRAWWDSVDTELRNEARALRRNKLLSAKAQEQALLALQNRRREQQILAVYRLRQAQGLPTRLTNTPAKI